MGKSSSRGKTPQQLGHDFQDAVQGVLSELPETTPTFFHRLYDSRSAGGYLPSQPGDFICLHKGRAVLIEAKSSGELESLAEGRGFTNLFDSFQVVKMRLWTRAGGAAFVIFQHHQTGDMEVWDGNYIAECFVTPRKRPERGRRTFFESGSLKYACLAMLEGRATR